jgi:hypothetical protein
VVVVATGNSSGAGRADLGLANDLKAAVTFVGVGVSTCVTINGNLSDQHVDLARQLLVGDADVAEAAVAEPVVEFGTERHGFPPL